MRKDLCDGDIIDGNGHLNTKYFNVKKGQYWSEREDAKLVEGVIECGPIKFAKIKQEFLNDWTETEIRLRIIKLFKYYDLDAYKNTEWKDLEQIQAEAE